MLRNWLKFLSRAAPDVHGQMCKELLRRTDSVFESWRDSGFERSFVEPILRAVKTTQDFPNCYFLPKDRLSDVVDDETYDFSSCELVLKLTKHFGLPESAFARAMQPDATIQSLIECVRVGHTEE